jgi:protein-disulfide isomerase
MQRRTVVSGLALVATAAGAGLWLTRAPEAQLPFAAEAQATGEVDKSPVLEMTLGNPDAKVEVVEYASFTCPHCKHFHDTVFGQLKANYIDTGKIHFIYREVYFDRFGLWAAMVARCGDGQRYFGISDLIYEKQEEWLAGGDPGAITANLRKIGKTAGLSDAQLDQCLNDAGMAQSLVAVYQENAQRDGVQATPTFFINGQKYSNMSYADFSKILDEKLGQ